MFSMFGLTLMAYLVPPPVDPSKRARLDPITAVAGRATPCPRDDPPWRPRPVRVGVPSRAQPRERVRVDPDPPQVGRARLTVDVTDMAWRPLNGAGVTVSAKRTDGGDAPVVVNAMGVGAGQYSVQELDFETAGPWTLTIRVEISGGRWTEVERTVAVRGETPP